MKSIAMYEKAAHDAREHWVQVADEARDAREIAKKLTQQEGAARERAHDASEELREAVHDLGVGVQASDADPKRRKLRRMVRGR